MAYGQSPAFRDAHKRAGELYAQGRHQEVLPFAEKAVRLGQREFGPDHTTTATWLNNLAEPYRVQGKYAEAGPFYNRALTIDEKALGPNHPHVAATLENYAALLRKTGRATEAAKMEARAEAIQAKHAR